MQDVNQVFLTKKKLAPNSTDVVSSSVSSSSSELIINTLFKSLFLLADFVHDAMLGHSLCYGPLNFCLLAICLFSP